MKKIIALTALLVSGAVSGAFAQQFSLGLRGGVNFASFSTEAAKDTEEGKTAAEAFKDSRRALAGAQAGVISNIAFNETFSVQPELLFSAKGYKQEWNDISIGGSGKNEYKTIMNYVELPILAKFSFGSEDKKVSLLAGPYIGYLAGGRVVEKQGGQEVRNEKLNFEYTDDNGQKFQRIDAGAAIGASFGYKTGTGTWMVDVRYNYGLTNIHEYQTPLDSEVEIYNRTFSVSLGWLFHFGESSLKPKPRPAEPMLDEYGQPVTQPGQTPTDQ